MEKVLYYDCFAGISGDMHLGAMVDLGVPVAHLEQELSLLKLEGFRLEHGRDKRKGIEGTAVRVVVDHPDNEKNRSLSVIEEIIENSMLAEEIRSRALDMFRRVARAEARVHGIELEEVHFHELGALDSIADIVGAAICQAYFKIDRILASPVQLGGGFVDCAHGTLPVPAPATAEILRGIPLKSGLVNYEACTPTGAAILASSVSEFGDLSMLRINATGYGIGQRDDEHIPNVLRVYLAEMEAPEEEEKLRADVERSGSLMLECNIDDMNPEWYTALLPSLYDAGARDVFLTPVQMKKSRPAHVLSVLCDQETADAIRHVIFSQSTTIGLRQYSVERYMLRREVLQLETEYGRVAVKRSYYGGRMVHEKPEFEQCVALARANKVSLEEIHRAVQKKL